MAKVVSIGGLIATEATDESLSNAVLQWILALGWEVWTSFNLNGLGVRKRCKEEVADVRTLLVGDEG